MRGDILDQIQKFIDLQHMKYDPQRSLNWSGSNR